MKIKLHHHAETELEQSIDWYQQIDPFLASALLHEFRIATNHLSKNPLVYRIRSNGFRRINLHRFPFYLPFVIHNDQIVILAFAHQSRLPHYWTDRKTSS